MPRLLSSFPLPSTYTPWMLPLLMRRSHLIWMIDSPKLNSKPDLEEAKIQENAKLQYALQEVQLEYKETKELLMKEHGVAKRAAEQILVIREVSVIDHAMLDKLTTESEELKSLISSLEKRIDET